MPEEEKPKKQRKEKEAWEVKQVPTQYGLAIVNEETEEILELNSALAKILNNQEKILKSL